MSLFDSKITKYIIKWGLFTHVNPEIFDGDKNLIGKMRLSGIMNKKLLLLDSSDKIVLTANKKNLAITRTYEVKDEKNNQVGIVKSKSILNYMELVMKDSNSNQVLKMDILKPKWGRYLAYLDRCEGFEINEPNGKKIAKVTTEDEDRKTELGKLEMSFTWTMDVFESSFDRKVLLGFLISIFSSNYDVNYRSGLVP